MSRLLAASLSLALVLGGTAPTAYAGGTVTAAAPAMVDGIATWSIELDSTRGTTTSPRIATSDFTLAALSWERSGPQPEHLELRVREGSAWSEWFELAVEPGPAPDGRLATEPFIADGSHGAQARLVADERVAGLRIDFVAAELTGLAGAPSPVSANLSSTVTASASAVLSGLPAVQGEAHGSELEPTIVSRKGWGANERGTEQVSSSTWLKAMYVHHTAGPNSYSRERAKAVVRSIWAFHTSGRGWPDIGYQFLVDRFGTVYEGRRGAIDGLPVGAQAGGFNADTIGVAVMGDFTRAEPPQRVIDSVVDVLSWQAHRYGVDPRGKVRLRTATSTGSEPRWPEGRLSPALPVIRGHRDTNHTSCPGARLYARLPAIRSAVDARVARAERRHGTPPAQLRAPKASTLDSPRVVVRATVRLSWREVPDAAGYEVLKRSAKLGKKAAQTKYAWMVEKRTTGTRAKVKIPRGQTWTFAVRAVDSLGRPGMVRTVGTTTRPVPAKRIELTGAWATAYRPEYLGGTAHVSRERGAALVVRKARAVRRVWLVAATGPTRGRVGVYAGARRVARVSLASTAPSSRALVRVDLPKRLSGTIRIRALDRNKPVRISAIILERGPLT